MDGSWMMLSGAAHRAMIRSEIRTTPEVMALSLVAG
jgi:hypothetical protein